VGQFRSIIVHYDGKPKVSAEFRGHLRAAAWDRYGRYLTVVGGKGYLARHEHENTVRINSYTSQNLRALSVNLADGSVLIVGNSGTVLLLDEQGHVTKLISPSSENLRAVAWNPSGTVALIAGNNGTLMEYSNERFRSIDGARANLRDISWRPGSNEALIVSNCFAGEFLPSPNLFTYNATHQDLQGVNESRADLIGVDWRPDGKSALVAGYDVVWHTGVIAEFDGRVASAVTFENKRVYPTSIRWDPSGKTAAIATATPEIGMGVGMICLWDGVNVSEVFRSNRFFFSDVTWAQGAYRLAAVASTTTRAFNA
jgi:WD40 repeat protein